MKNIAMTNREKTAHYAAVKNESAIAAEQLIREIYPLINEYFFCNTDCRGKAIHLSFANGQRFILTAAEIK